MIEETAQVVAVSEDTADVEVARQSVCGQCAANKGCGTALLQNVVGTKRSRIRVLSNIPLIPGDKVIIGLNESALVRGSAALYLLPVVLMIFFAAMGELLAPQWSIENSELLSITFALCGLVVGGIWLRRFTRHMKYDVRYQPIVLRKDCAQTTATLAKYVD